MEDKILGNCDCPGGPRVLSKLYPNAIYLHVQTPQGIRCCRRSPEGDVLYGTIIELSPEKIAFRKESEKIAIAAGLKKSEKKKKKKDLIEKRKRGEVMSQDDLNNLVDTLLP